jgi:phage shock protein PspC (stress-responsive transcriptional regulator)
MPGVSGSTPVSPDPGSDQGDPRWCSRSGKDRLSTVSEINLEHTVRDFWATRPRRRADDRKIAGVAAAISRRYAIDPVLVRVAFVVLTLSGGSGILLYLLGWLLLPTGGDEVSAAESVFGRGRSSMSATLTIVLVLLLVPATGAVFGERTTGLLGLAVAVGALLLLHRSRAGLGEIPGSPPPEGALSPTSPATAQGGPGTTTPAGSTTADGPTPPAWDPLGAAPFAWDLPEPSAPPAPAAPPRAARSKVTPITLGLALLTGGIAVAFWPALAAAQIAALLLGVIGLGLVAGSFLQGGRGLILLAVPLALLTWVLQAAPASGFEVGNSYWNPDTAATVQSRWESGRPMSSCRRTWTSR